MAKRANDMTASAPLAVEVTLPPALIRLFPGAASRLNLAAASVADIVEALDQRWPGMRDRLIDSTPRIRRHINVFVEGRRAGLETRLDPGAKVFIITAVSGG
jgi:molybdopterin synthase sulfur carrier subunit